MGEEGEEGGKKKGRRKGKRGGEGRKTHCILENNISISKS